MKLYIYEHCPFCSRVLYIARKLGVNLEEVVVGYDDVETPTTLIGKKKVPILVKDNGEVMAESGDIITCLLDIKMSNEVRTPSKQALDWQSRAFYTLIRIGYPRWSQFKLEEFSTKESRAAWIERKQSDTMFCIR
ncbi:glutaredoxin 2 [Vibrio hannami]|uniref:glutaredoxin 2 n=1 Tax=Vibrio hannami TaxID=2717094 RepID=UPI00240F9A5F|nr:glutaredoxin 2 [Vibrio hannami]MDG3088566.1 glutaredoxin 2 [Vibrio hannami]